jgi:hypothetical protein
MACNHKFIEYLNADNLNFNPKYLIIGTFNPEWPEDNYAEWFYGRTNNNYFWEILPRMFQEESLRFNFNHIDWKKFCVKNQIVLTDLISSINDADQDNPHHYEVISKFKDTEFANTFMDFQMTNVVGILEKYPSIDRIYFTRNPGVDLFDNEINAINNYCLNNNILFSHLITPSKNARFQMTGYIPQNPNLERNLSNFIYEKWLANWG